MKTVESLVPEDFSISPVWEYTSYGGIFGGESTVEPVKDEIITHLRNRIVGIIVLLNNSRREFCMLGNIHLHNRVATEHFLMASFCRNGKWFHLNRYHDIDYPKCGPCELAAFLGLVVEEVFPIRYRLAQIDGIVESLASKETLERDQKEEILGNPWERGFGRGGIAGCGGVQP